MQVAAEEFMCTKKLPGKVSDLQIIQDCKFYIFCCIFFFHWLSLYSAKCVRLYNAVKISSKDIYNSLDNV